MISLANRFLEAALTLLVLALAAFLRFYHLNSYSLWSDEFVTLMIASAKSSRELLHTCFEIPQPMPPLYFLLTRMPLVWFGPSETSLRLLSAISSLLVVYLAIRLGRKLFSAEIGLFAGLLCAVNTTQIVYAQNARPYAFCLMLSCCSYLMFLQWLQTGQTRFQIGHVVSTTLLFYGHYIFFPLVLSQNLFFWWRRTRLIASSKDSTSPSWKTWLMLQGMVGLLLLPLMPQLTTILRTRYSLNWQKELPQYSDFFVFVNGRPLIFAVVSVILIAGIGNFLKKLWDARAERPLKKIPPPMNTSCARRFQWDSLVLLSFWYFVPVLMFFISAKVLGLNLFVERYLVLSTIPAVLMISAIPFSLPQKRVARLFLVVYSLLYAYMEPGAYYREKGEFSQGVPGANEWRETLMELRNPAFDAPLFLFQSPFIESNQLNFAQDPLLLRYLSSPLKSFYMAGSQRSFVLMPVHWWINNEKHLEFKARTRELILSNPDFSVLSTQEFWDNFYPWLEREFSSQYRICEVRSFASTGALRLKRVQLFLKTHL